MVSQKKRLTPGRGANGSKQYISGETEDFFASQSRNNTDSGITSLD